MRVPSRWQIIFVVSGLLALLGMWRRLGLGWSRVPRWYSLVYRACYLAGLRIWERHAPPSDLRTLVEGLDELSLGRALDIGCRTGTDSIYLAQHGWDVTGVDMVHEALAIARRNAAAAGASVYFVQGDATRLSEVAPGPFDLLFDFGCFHTLPTDQRPAYVDSFSAVAASGAMLLLYGFARPPRLAPVLLQRDGAGSLTTGGRVDGVPAL